MSTGRAGVFDDDDDALDVSSFAPKPAAPPGVSSDQVRAVSEGAQFRSRDPAPPPAPADKRPPRRYRTGRNVQLNVKARAEAIDAFYAIADAQGWVLGEAFEKAVTALQREIAGRD